MSHTVEYSGPLNGFLEPLGGSVLLNGTVEYSDSAGARRHEGKFRLQMFGGIVLYDADGNSLSMVLPSQVRKASGERWGYSKGNCVTWYPTQRLLVFVL